MISPLQEKSYELIVRVTSIHIVDAGDWRIRKLRKRLFEEAIHFASGIETTICSPDKDRFRERLHDVHQALRQIKLWVRLLDDLGFIDPETAVPLNDIAEEVHRLVIAALKKVSQPDQRLRYDSNDFNGR
ncbi:MAG: hypothetical protein HYX66_08125 [Ignavibacteria bacterium]|nr:hypothetical protein [Ignavibacteria bacterium]